MFCNNCGRVIEGDAKFCGKCGAKVEKSKFDNNIEELEVQADSNNKEEFINQNCNIFRTGNFGIVINRYFSIILGIHH